MAEGNLLRYGVEGAVATITLDNPARLNPLAIPLQHAMLAMLERVRADAAVRVLVITGAGRAFCVGADLTGMQGADASGKSLGDSTADIMETLSNPLIAALREMPVPVVASVNGPAAGAGVGLALSADVVVAARSAYFYLPFMTRLGIVPDLGTTWYVPRLIGRARATGLTLLGDRLPAEQAAQWGLIWSCVDDDQLPAETLKIASRLAALPVHAVAETRRAYDVAEANTLPRQLQFEADRQRELVNRDSFAEGVHAFLEKREPRFRGR
ncbi:MAG: enoyl-CoA hydratase-related protein [Burkholderiales bacterium]